ncbi:hypothetical protein SELMODRAFT_79374 [Selaginella moellendorffii]|uniref:G10 protein n=1 Tax=Selaginella moellendorffii TaxID=88036 RepID=D8QY85_SELML|nr:protein BUD31 homolog 3 [Selaginella moellendorffii]EFJ35569.1 hypothetical protein SELMODRAFT_79374 [Selaginella moellendorffii]|eukprot:XP_002963698.1 protein BUD31 homolog 3 [Selaginella moellendorffii]
MRLPSVKPEGWSQIEERLNSFETRMREVVNNPIEDKRRCEDSWEISKINHQRSRYIFDLYHKEKTISRELYEFCVEYKLVDGSLMTHWKRQGFETLCCSSCIHKANFTFGTGCVCRVPRTNREVKVLECQTCGCKGCASGD